MSPTPPRSPASRPERRPRRRPARPVPRRRPRWAVRATMTLSVVVLASAGIGHSLVGGLDSGIARVDPFRDMKNRPPAGHGMNVLMVGTDGRDRITEAERRRYRLGGAPCHCTDTLMILHISRDRDRASVVSLPRDSYAETPPHTDLTTGEKHHSHPIKINAAYSEGGPQLTVRTVEHMTRVKIDHYLEIDFTSFMKTVDVLGGVRICTARRLTDPYTGLDLAPGRHTLRGGEALQYVRSRHSDASSDLGRMRRQQQFLAGLVDRATSSGILLNPLRFRDVTRAVLGSVRADRGFGTDELLDLGRAMRTFSPSSSEFATVPIGRMGYAVKGIGSTVKWDPVRAGRLFRALRDDKPLATASRPRERAVHVEVAPRQIRVQVENGTRTPGLAGRVDAALRAAGFRTTGQPATARDTTVRRTVVSHDPRWDRSAKSLAAALPGSVLRPVPGLGPTLRVTTGTQAHHVRRVRADAPDRNGSAVVRGDEVGCV
ncbi:LCP family protein [Streptomyces sp. NPDC003401]